jgi:hypothetical protein
MKLPVINPNTTQAMTDVILGGAGFVGVAAVNSY